MTVPVFSPRYMGDADGVLWSIGRDPVLRAPITAIAVLDHAPDWAQLHARVERATRLIPRLRQVAVDSALRLMPPRWVIDPGFDVDHHLRRVAAPPPRTMATVVDLAAHLSMEDFDRARPLWTFLVIEGLKGSKAALVVKVHHALTDGEGAVQLAMHLFDLTLAASLDERPMPPEPAGESLGRARLARDLAADVAGRAGRGGARVARAAADVSRGALVSPLGTARRAVRVAGSVGRVMAPALDARSSLLRGRSTAWHMRVFDVPLDELRRAARVAGGTVNDAFMGGAAGGFRRYHEQRGVEIGELRVNMPISYRRPGDPLGGNHFLPARFLVPVGEPDAAARIQAIGERCRSRREEPALGLTDTIAGVLGRLPAGVTTLVMGAMLKHVDFVATNVAGIRQPLYLAGARVERLYPFAPLCGAAVNVALYSHDDVCCIGLSADDAAVADIDELLRCMREGFDEVLALAHRSPQEDLP